MIYIDGLKRQGRWQTDLLSPSEEALNPAPTSDKRIRSLLTKEHKRKDPPIPAAFSSISEAKRGLGFPSARVLDMQSYYFVLRHLMEQNEALQEDWRAM